MQGTYYLVASTNPSLRQVTLTASFFKAAISVGDTLAGYTNTSKPLGTVRPCFFRMYSCPAPPSEFVLEPACLAIKATRGSLKDEQPAAITGLHARLCLDVFSQQQLLWACF